MSCSLAEPISPRHNQRRRRDTPRMRKALFSLPVERLEPRQVPAIVALPPSLSVVPAVEPISTLDVAQNVGEISATAPVAVSGSLGAWNHAANDVDWYEFELTAPSTVHLSLGPAHDTGTFQGVISLYNNDPFDFSDLYVQTGHRLLAQVQAAGSGGLASLDRSLAAGIYYVAVSGAGDLDFHPFLAGSGLDGSTGDYDMLLTATPVATDAVGPAVLAADPAAGSVLSSSPLVLRFDLSASIDPSTLAPGQSVQLVYNPTGNFGDGQDADVTLGSINFSDAAHELQLYPQRALAPGYYEVILSGDSTTGNLVLTSSDGSGTPLGATVSQPGGRDYVMTFQVNGIEGGTTSDDTAATAHQLDDVTGAEIVRATGAIGDDPYYDPNSSDPTESSLGNDVDMYRFQVLGSGQYAFIAEVFAGRIGSMLDPGVALYRVDPADGTLHFIDGNNNSLDPTHSTNGSPVLLSDPVLFASLTAGDYVVAVSAGFNTPSPRESQPIDSPGMYDPNVSHSGQNGWSTGPYTLNLRVERCDSAPRVVATSPRAADILDAPPTELTVQFSGSVNLQSLAFTAYQQSWDAALPAVSILASDGTKYFPRLSSYDPTTHKATFLMLDGLPNGSYEWHLSGAAGLTDLAGNPLVGTSSGGDYVIPFVVQGPMRGVNGNSRQLAAQPPAPGETAQDLGVLFPHDLQAGIDLTRDAAVMNDQKSGTTEDAFKFQVLQTQMYSFAVTPDPMPAGMSLWLTDTAGKSIPFGTVGDGSTILAELHPGFYVLHVGGWSTDQSASLSYQVQMVLEIAYDNPTPLVSGPAPAIQLHLDNAPMPAPLGPLQDGTSPSGFSTSQNLMGSSAPLPVVGSSEGAPAQAPALGGGGMVSATVTSRAISSGELIALGVGPVGDVTGPATSTYTSAPVELALGQAPLTAGQGLPALLTFLHGYGWDDVIAPSATDQVLGDTQVPSLAVQAKATEPAPMPEPERITVDLSAPTEFLPVAGDVPVATAQLTEQVDARPAGRRMMETDDAQRADLGWFAGLTAFGAMTLTLLRRHQSGRFITAVRGVAPAGPQVPGLPLGLAGAARVERRRFRRRGFPLMSRQAT